MAETQLYTAEEFWDWWTQHGEEDVRYELEQGVIIEMPLPGPFHGTVLFLITRLIGNWLFNRGQGYACSHDSSLLVEEHPDTVRGTDLMIFAESISLGEIPRVTMKAVPSLIIEVLSPNDTYSNTVRRVNQYLKRGVPLVWIVEPEVQTITVNRLDQNPVVFTAADTVTGEDVLPDMKFQVGDFFRLPGDQAQKGQP